MKKVTYANMVVHSSVFRCPAVMQVGFQTMLYHSTLMIEYGDIFEHFQVCEAVEERSVIFRSFHIVVEVVGSDSYTLKQMEEYPKLAPVNPNNPVAEHFARMNCMQPLEG